jgi:hypothetical protein
LNFEVVFQPFAGLTKTYAAPFWYVLPTVANIAPTSARKKVVQNNVLRSRLAATDVKRKRK